MLFKFSSFFLAASNLFSRSTIMQTLIFSSQISPLTQHSFLCLIVLPLSSYFIKLIFFKILLQCKVLVGDPFLFFGLCFLYD